jgi:hypothetical protein
MTNFDSNFLLILLIISVITNALTYIRYFFEKKKNEYLESMYDESKNHQKYFD